MALSIVRYATLTVITVVAATVMWWVSKRSSDAGSEQRGQPVAQVPAIAQPKTLVSVRRVEAKPRELTAKFSGKVQPWEVFTLSFEVGGRIVALGESEQGGPLDDGDAVTAGQVLARLDDRIFRARTSEASAQLEQATTDMRRIRSLRERNPGAVTETEFQQQLTQLALARAQNEVALKNLDDATLLSPVEATISQRMVNVGESIQPNQTAFELVQDQEVLLVIDVPESEIPEFQARTRAVQTNRQMATAEVDDEDRVFRAYVTLEGPDRFGRRRPRFEGEVYRIAQTADERTGLFEVEIRVPNRDRSLRAGMVATAQVVLDRINAYRLPDTALIFRDGQSHLFSVAKETVPLQVMFWKNGSRNVFSAKRQALSRWIDQGGHVLVPAEDQELDLIVVRGQQRLSDGQLVRLAGKTTDGITAAHRDPTKPLPLIDDIPRID